MITNYNSVFQGLITRFMKDKIIAQETEGSLVGRDRVYTIGESTSVYLPSSDFYNVFPGAIIIANNESRYLLSKTDPDSPAILNLPVNWYNGGLGFKYTYKNPISQIIDSNNDITGYITSDNKIYITGETDEINTSQVSSQTNGLKLLNSDGYGLYISSDGNVYLGDSITNDWENLGEMSGIDISNLVSKTDIDVSSNSWVLDEDLMVSDSNEKLATQQSVKTYVDEKPIDGGEF